MTLEEKMIAAHKAGRKLAEKHKQEPRHVLNGINKIASDLYPLSDQGQEFETFHRWLSWREPSLEGKSSQVRIGKHWGEPLQVAPDPLRTKQSARARVVHGSCPC